MSDSVKNIFVRILIVLFFIISILFYIFIYYEEESNNILKLETQTRLAELNTIRNAVLKSNVPHKDLSLFSILNIDNMRGFLFLIPGYDHSDNSRKLLNRFVKNSTKKNFYEYCQYRLIKDELNWWAIVELCTSSQGHRK